MALGTRRLNVFEVEHGLIPVLHSPMRGLTRGRAPLTLVTNRAPKLVKRVPVVVRVIGARQRKPGVAGILDRNMATGAAVHSIQLRQHNLPNFNGNTRGIGALLGRGCASLLVLDILALPVLPFPVL